MNELNVLQQIADSSGKTDKELLLKANVSNKKLQELLDAAFNYKRRFFLKKFEYQTQAVNYKCKHDDFMKILSILESETLRGNAAKSAVETFFTTLNPLQALWYERVLIQNLRAGFSVGTANEAGFSIPEFEVMLAKDGKKLPKTEQIVKNGGFASKKFDGYRCLTEIVDGNVTMMTRNGNLFENFPEIAKTLAQLLPTGRHVIDGEIMSNDFQAMQMTAFASTRGTTVGDVVYHIFDCIPYKEWHSCNFKSVKSERIKLLETYRSLIESTTNLRIVEQVPVNSLSRVLDLEMEYISQGYEGVMFLPDIPYYYGKKSNRMMKFKTAKSQDVQIVGFYLGESGGKYEHTLGGVNVLQDNGEESNVGSGFSDEARDFIWKNQDKFLGRMFEARYQEESKDGIMRFGVFFRWRDLDQKSGKI